MILHRILGNCQAQILRYALIKIIDLADYLIISESKSTNNNNHNIYYKMYQKFNVV